MTSREFAERAAIWLVGVVLGVLIDAAMLPNDPPVVTLSMVAFAAVMLACDCVGVLTARTAAALKTDPSHPPNREESRPC